MQKQLEDEHKKGDNHYYRGSTPSSMKDTAMLIQFRVKNFRSIKNEQVLSMVASPDASMSQNTFRITKAKKGNTLDKTSFLKSAVIYGANASGKTNILKAMTWLFGLLSATEPVRLDTIFSDSRQSFALDDESAKSPTELSVTFTIGNEGIRHDFHLAVQNGQVVEELLDYYPHGRKSTLYHRTLKSTFRDKYSWKFPGGNLKGDKLGLRDKTSKHTLFLSVASAFNHPQLGKISSWFSSTSAAPSHYIPYSLFARGYMDYLNKNVGSTNRIRTWMEVADLGIKNYQISQHDTKIEAPEGKPQGEMGGGPTFSFLHTAQDGKPSYINLDDESSGTQRWFSLFFMIYNVLENGSILVIDEISADLHPLLVEYIFKVFHSPKMNPLNAQLICTTHHSTLLAAKILRRDQIWFAEKDNSGVSYYYSLLDFSPRKDEALMKGYLAGSYGAVPNFDMFDEYLNK